MATGSYDFKIDFVELCEKNDAFENDSMESLNQETSVKCETEIGNATDRSSLKRLRQSTLKEEKQHRKKAKLSQ